jgi:hypothetical protein
LWSRHEHLNHCLRAWPCNLHTLTWSA